MAISGILSLPLLPSTTTASNSWLMQRSRILLVAMGIPLMMIYIFSNPHSAPTGLSASLGRLRLIVRLRCNPSNLCVRRQFRHTEIPACAKHRESQRLHIRGGAGAAPSSHVGGSVHVPVGPAGGSAGAQPVAMGYCGSAVPVYRGFLRWLAA